MGIRRRLIAVDGDGDEYYGVMEWNKWKHEICPSWCDAINHGTCLLHQWITYLQTHDKLSRLIFYAESNGVAGSSR